MPDALETALRELRETPSDEFAAELDARVAAGFGRGRRPGSDAPGRGVPGASRPPAGRPRRLPGWLLPAGGFAVAAVLCLVVVVGTIGGSGTDGGSAGGGGSSSAASESSAGAGGSSSADSSGGAGAASAPQASSGGSSGSRAAPPVTGATPGRDRKVERSAQLTLAVAADRVEAAAADVSDVTDRAGGYVESSDVEARDEASFVLRVPAGRLDGAMAALARIGTVDARRQSSEDITATFNQARGALGEARALRTSLLRRLGAAETDAETASLRAQLRDANASIAAARRAVRQVGRRASFARVDVTVRAQRAGDSAPADEDDGGGWGIGAAWDDAARGLEVAAGVLVLVLAFLVPLGLLVGLGVGGRRAAVSRARRRALDTA